MGWPRLSGIGSGTSAPSALLPAHCPAHLSPSPFNLLKCHEIHPFNLLHNLPTPLPTPSLVSANILVPCARDGMGKFVHIHAPDYVLQEWRKNALLCRPYPSSVLCPQWSQIRLTVGIQRCLKCTISCVFNENMQFLAGGRKMMLCLSLQSRVDLFRWFSTDGEENA